MSIITIKSPEGRHIVLFSQNFQKQFSIGRMKEMNLFPICEYNNIKYFYTNVYNVLYEEEVNGKIIIIDRPIEDICHYIVTDLFIQAIKLEITDLHIINNKVLYKKQGQHIHIEYINSQQIEDIQRFLKVYCDLNIFSNEDESTVIHTLFLDECISVRVSFFPTDNKPLISFRFIYSKPIKKEILEDSFNKEKMNKLINKHQLIVVGGITGLGKSTFMYKMIKNYQHFNEEKMIISAEDPVEHILPGLIQRNVENNNYETIIKSILRHRPDLIIIGEIRDQETALALLRALLTGHKVICTLHMSSNKVWTNIIHRMEELGVNPAHLKIYLTCIIIMKEQYEYDIYER